MNPVWPVSVKGIVVSHNRVLLARNDRDEWELPGGRLEPGESPQQCVAREVAEETGLRVEVGPPVRNWVFEVVPQRHVLVLAYGCRLIGPDDQEPVVSDEHTTVRFIALARLGGLALPDGYRAAIDDWISLRARQDSNLQPLDP